jgi:ketol-acid reductoisomerase
MKVKLYYDQDADLNLIRKKTVGIIGYGSQGHAQAQNLRDSGVKVIVSDLPGTVGFIQARKHGFKPVSAKELAQRADIIQMLVEDETQSKVYEIIKPYLTAGKALCFSHGFNIHFKRIIPAANVAVFMVAPKGPGRTVRIEYMHGSGVPCLIALHQGPKDATKKLALSYAKAIGGTRAGVIETTFREETETDLFGEQAVLCGGISALIRAGFETLVKAGYSPLMAYFECLHESKLITDMIYKGGIAYMRDCVSNTAEYGDYIAGPKVINAQSKKEMEILLKNIQNGSFARQWMKENDVHKQKNFQAMRKKDAKHQIETVGAFLRKNFKFAKDQSDE